MTAGSSLSKQIGSVVAAIVVTSIAYTGYLSTIGSLTLELVAFGFAFLIPASAALYFRQKVTAAVQERDNMRLMLQARADEMSDESNATPAKLADELSRTAYLCKKIAAGDFETRILNIDPENPLSATQEAINDLVDRTDAFIREAKASMEHVAEQKYYRRIIESDMSGSFKSTAASINNCTQSFAARTAKFEGIVEQFEAQIGTVSKSIHETSETLHNSAANLSSNASSTAEQVKIVGGAAVSASASVQTVASSAEEMSASIQEISRQIQHSLSNTSTARETARSGNVKIKGLAESAQSIGEVVKLIEDIANQTNLLALNATIEAARAGDAGKGFAVVANEVKNLASQTAKATEDISRQIVNIQDATTDTVQSMDTINSSIEDISSAVETIANAVDEQSSATREISQSVLSASNNTQSVSDNISTVANATAETSDTSGQLLIEANVLQGKSEDLEKNVANFLTEIRKAI